jgi:hypothetical protein
MTCALRQRLVFGMWHATRQPTSLAHPMVARGEDDGHLAAAGVFQGVFCGLRSGRASAKMPFEFPIRSGRWRLAAATTKVHVFSSPSIYSVNLIRS